MYNQAKDTKNIFSLLKTLWPYLKKVRRNQIKFLLIIVILNGFAEVISIASLVPYLAILVSPESVLKYDFVKYIINIFNIKSEFELVLLFTFAFLFTTILAAFIKFIFNFLYLRVSSNLGSDLSIAAFSNSLHKPYSYHINSNSNILITTITKDINEIVYYIFNPIFQLISSIFISLSIVLTLLFINFNVAFVSFILIILIYYLFLKLTSKPIQTLSKRNVIISQRLTKLIQESLGAIRDITLAGNQKYYINKFELDFRNYSKDVSMGTFLNYLPRLIIEPLGIIIIIVLSYYLVIIGEVKNAIPILGALTFSAVRLLPLAQRIYEGVTYPRLAKSRLANLLSLLENKPKKNKRKNNKKYSFVFKNEIKISNLSFRYSNKSSFIVKDLNLSLKAGDKIGIIGTTGQGKSTLIDLIMGLIKPSKGNIYIDQNSLFDKTNNDMITSWQNSFIHVPQNIFLSDLSIAENIAFGIPKSQIDFQKLYDVSKKSLILHYIENLKEGFNTVIGERGVKLSGGQRQRIGIARALYKGSKTIFLDEATSALDTDTEKLVMKNIYELGPDITLIIIAHRLNTLRYCNKIIELKNGKAIERETFIE